MHGDRQQAAPEQTHQHQHNQQPAQHPAQLIQADRQQVTKQVSHQIYPHVFGQCQHYQAQRQRTVRENPQQGVAGQPVFMLQRHQQHRDQHAAHRHGKRQVDVQQHAKRHTKQCRVGEGVTEIGHAPPDHKRPQRAGNQRQPQAGEQRVNEKIRHACSWVRGCVRGALLRHADHGRGRDGGCRRQARWLAHRTWQQRPGPG